MSAKVVVEQHLSIDPRSIPMRTECSADCWYLQLLKAARLWADSTVDAEALLSGELQTALSG